MTLIEELPPYILAPFITDIDPETKEATLKVPNGIRDRLMKKAFTENVFPDRTPGSAKMHLHEVNASQDGDNVTMEELIETEFGLKNREWNARKDKAMKQRGFIQDQTGWVDDQVSNTAIRAARDDNLFTVRVDNLPENMSQAILSKEILNAGCNYFTKIVVPRDLETNEPKRFGFVKFERLRYALKFLEDYHKAIKVSGMVINSTLVV